MRVDAPEPVPQSGWEKASTVSQIAELGQNGFYMRNPAGYYFTGNNYTVKDSRTGIRKTKPPTSTPDAAVGAVKYYFEQVTGTEDQFRSTVWTETRNSISGRTATVCC